MAAPRRTAMPYMEALQWLLDNDDTEWMTDNNGYDDEAWERCSVTGSLIADIYRRSTEELTADLFALKSKNERLESNG